MEKSLQRLARVATTLTLLLAVWTQVARAQEQDEYYELMRVFVDTFEQIDRNYVKDVDRQELVEAAVRGMLAKLDPYSDYISPQDLERFNEAVEQEFGGVGIQVHFDREQRSIEVMTPLPGSPAYEAGVRAGDRIVEIEGRKVKEFPEGREIDTAVKLLKGEPGVQVKVGIRHPGSTEVEQVVITREIIQLDTVLGNTYNGDGSWDFMIDKEQKVGYLRLTHFTRRSAAEVRAALRKLREQGMQGLILDLRFNPGGRLQAAVEIADMFVESGKIVSTEGRNSSPHTWSAKKFGTFSGFPMAILVNRYSASASEIVSACLQDHDRAVVVGERTWGKGSVQTVIDLDDGDSKLKLTTASYYRPSGKNIHRFPKATEEDEWGVVPDEGFDVEFSFDQMRQYQRDRQQRDVLGSDEVPESEFVDTQLEKAMEYVRGAIAAETSPGDDPEPDAATGDAEPEADEEKAKNVEKDAASPIRLPLLAPATAT
ncbi:MAG: S41 family peptidase [Maioricimonas sp. JB049]